jgi:hypothetical protein
MIMIHPELRRALATERERSLREKAQRASLLRDPARPTPPASAHRRPFILARLTIALRGRLSSHPCAPVRYRACEAGAEGGAEDEGPSGFAVRGSGLGDPEDALGDD